MKQTLKNTNILVTGISGFIGSRLAKTLVAEGAYVHGLVKGDSDLWRINDIANVIELYEADLTKFEAVRKIVHSIKPRIVFHLAAYVNSRRDLSELERLINVNVTGTFNLLSSLSDIDYDCFVNTGTCEEYGNNVAPFDENQNPNPVSPYSFSKVVSTLLCQMLFKMQSSPIVTIRPFLTYGPGQIGEMFIPSLLRKLINREDFEMTPGEQTREFNYVDDIVDGFIKAAIEPKALGTVINIGNGKEYQVKYVAEFVADLLNSRDKLKIGALSYRTGEAWHFYCDNSRAKNLLGWNPRTGLESGLLKTIEWAKEYYTKGRRNG